MTASVVKGFLDQLRRAPKQHPRRVIEASFHSRQPFSLLESHARFHLFPLFTTLIHTSLYITMSAILGTLSKFAIPVGAAVSFLQYSMYDGTYYWKLISRSSQSSYSNNRSDHNSRREESQGTKGIQSASQRIQQHTSSAPFAFLWRLFSEEENVVSEAMATNNGQGQRRLS